MDALRDRRRAMMAAAGPAPSELYPVGTDIKNLYAPYPDAWLSGRTIGSTTGNIVESSGGYCSDVYIPIDPAYSYRKNGNRMNYNAWYDEDKVFISSFREYNVDTKALPAAPSNARYLRISSTSAVFASALSIIRTA